MGDWRVLLAIGAGGAVGAIARHGVSRLALQWFGPGFPVGTMLVNVAGSFAMGLLIHWLSGREASNVLRALLAVGALGGFTTFSTFSLDAVVLLRDRSLLVAALYIGGSVILSVSALFGGLLLGRSVS